MKTLLTILMTLSLWSCGQTIKQYELEAIADTCIDNGGTIRIHAVVRVFTVYCENGMQVQISRDQLKTTYTQENYK